jgi:putative endonuclease
MSYGGFVYIMTNVHHTVLYTGVTSDLYSRISEHKEKFNRRSFTYKYNIELLVYFETFDSIEEAIEREKQLKKYSRIRKVTLIYNFNPYWKDLYEEISDW